MIMNVKFKKATLLDVENIRNLVAPEVESGVILERTPEEISTNIRSYTLAYVEESLVGFSALHIHSPILAEIRSLIVKDSFRGLGIGYKLVNKLNKEAIELGVKKILTLTYKQKFFEKLGFIEIPKESIPEHKIWADCIKCKHFPICNEVSLIKMI